MILTCCMRAVANFSNVSTHNIIIYVTSKHQVNPKSCKILERPMARWCRFGNIDPIPFHGRSFSQSMFRSGSTHPRAIAVDAEPSSTSAFQGLVRIVATTTKIGTGGRSGPARARTFSTPSYSQSKELCSAAGNGWRRLGALHFQGRLLRQVSCYTLLGGFRLPWPPSCCLERSTPFCGIS